jgi:cell division protein FtsA
MAAAELQRADAAPRTPAPLAAALDVGVSKTVCLAARRDPVLELHPGRPLRVLGVGVQTAPASASGVGADFEACARAIHVAVEEASFMAGAPITRVTAAYAGPGVGASIVRGSVKVRGGRVADRDVRAALDAASHAGAGARRVVLHVEPLRYQLDDAEPILDPYGQSGRNLAAEACVVTAPAEAVQALRACIRQAGFDVEDIIAAPHAIGVSALTAEERDEGALVVDLGAGALGVAVFAAEGLVHAETAAIGGVRLTRDLAAKLGTTFAAAERIKLAFGAVGGGFNPEEAISAPRLGPDGRLEAAATFKGVIAETLAPRLHEVLLSARARLAKAGFSGAAGPGRAVLVGGGALLPGAKEAAAEVLGVPVRVGRLFDLCGFEHGEAGPAFACAAGALRWRLDNPTLDDVDESFTPSLKGAAEALRSAAGNAARWLADNF